MPASHEKIPNRALSGYELAQIIKKKVDEKLSRDGMFTVNIAYERVSFEVMVTVHMDNPHYPQHVSQILSTGPSKQEVAKNPELGSLETFPLSGNLEDEIVFGEETKVVIQSPNMARVENDLPILEQKLDLGTGQLKNRNIMYKGDMPDPAEVGNSTEVVNKSEEAKANINKRKKGKK